MKKFLSELKLCYGGGTTSTEPTTEEITVQFPRQEARAVLINYDTGKNTEQNASSHKSRSRRRLKRMHSSANWKPVLSAILENNVINVSDAAFTKNGTGKQTAAVRSDGNFSGKRKSARAGCYSSENYRKSVDPTSLPAFSPTPFVF